MAVVLYFLAVHFRCFYLTSIFIVKNMHLNTASEAYLGAESVRLGPYDIPFRGSFPLPNVWNDAVGRPQASRQDK